jgi:hypothetical protein
MAENKFVCIFKFNGVTVSAEGNTLDEAIAYAKSFCPPVEGSRPAARSHPRQNQPRGASAQEESPRPVGREDGPATPKAEKASGGVRRPPCRDGADCSKKETTCPFWHPGRCLHGVKCNRKETCKFWHPKPKDQ